MISSIVTASALSLWRDRSTFMLTFILPCVIYAVFALVFSSAAGGEMRVRIGVFSTPEQIPTTIVNNLKTSPEAAQIWVADNKAELEAAIRSTKLDVGIAIEQTQTKPLKITIIADATRNGAAVVAQSALMRQLRSDIRAETQTTYINPVNSGQPMAAYFAAGVGMLFLLLSGFQSSLSLIEDRDAGVIERLAVSPFGLAPLIIGRFVFICLQGFFQLTAIFCIATFVFEVEFFHSLSLLILAMITAVVGASGFCLAITSLCKSRSDAHAIGTVLSLIFAALGGSMAPAFLMPQNIQKIGGWTLNALGLDAFAVPLWKGGDLGVILLPCLSMGGYGIIGLIIAYIFFPKTLSHH